MTGSELAHKVIQNPSQAPKLLANHPGMPGVTQAVFDTLLQFYAEDHAAVVRLAPTVKALTKHGDLPALSFRCLGIVERCRGNWMASAKAFLRAGELADNSVEMNSFAIGAIDALARAGSTDQAIDLGKKLSKQLTELGYPAVAARAKLNVAYALMQQDRYQESLKQLNGVAEVLSEAEYSVDSISSLVAESTSLLFADRPSRARDKANQAVVRAEELDIELLANIAKGNSAYTFILSGEPDLAVPQLLTLKAQHADEPVELARVLEYLGDAYTAMNLYAEAADAYQEAIHLGVTFGKLHRAHLQYGLGRASLFSGKHEVARHCLEEAAKGYRKLGNLNWQVAAEIDLAVAEIESGFANGKRRLGRVVKADSSRVSVLQRARAHLTLAEQTGSRTALANASALIRKGELHQFLWRTEYQKAKGTVGAGRLKHYRQMFQAILEDQAKTSSVSGRLSFYMDKHLAIREYLSELLGQPSLKRIHEAVEVIVQTRSVTLLDEVLLANGSELSETSISVLANLREDLNPGKPNFGLEGSRRAGSLHQDMDRLRRIWLEGTFDSGETLSHRQSGLIARDDSCLFVAESEIFALTGSRMMNIGSSDSDLASEMDWFNFDIIAPMADPEAPGESVLATIQSLAGRFVRPLISDKCRVGVCPDGQLWRIPWLACADLAGDQIDIEIRLHPGLSGFLPAVTELPPMLWVAEHEDLPRAREEAEQFLQRYPNAQVCRTVSEVRDVLKGGRASMLHVISHSRHRPIHPMFSSLDFTDGSILAAEIARSGLRVGMVTLSGCDTARLSGVNRFEPDGLVRAFLARGAGYVVGSAWPLDDEAAMKFYSHFYEDFDIGANIHQSLRYARQAVRKWKSHPYYWAFPLLYAGYQS